jgi:hypothetical protein
MALIDTFPAWAPLCGAALGGGGIGAGLRPILDYWKGRQTQTDTVAMGLVEKLQARIERDRAGEGGRGCRQGQGAAQSRLIPSTSKDLTMWTWDQSAGLLSRAGQSWRGYSGAGRGKNNPALQSVAGLGPIPRGRWTIAGRHDSPTTGPCTLVLTPEAGTATLGRSEFRIHGDSIVHPGSASHGCIILPRAVRDAIWASGDRALLVIA